MIRDRLSWMRLQGFPLAIVGPDENTIRHFRSHMTGTDTLKRAMKAFEWQLHKEGHIPMSGEILDGLPRARAQAAQHRWRAGCHRGGQTAQEIRRGEPSMAGQKDSDARWSLKIGGKMLYRPEGTPLPKIAIPVFGFKSHISIDRRY